jgi:DNA-binding FadR family transcriptional regulator
MAPPLILGQLPRKQSRCQLVVQRLRDGIAHGHLAVREHLPSERRLNTASLRPMRQLIVDTARETFGDVMDARLILEVASAGRAAQKASICP